MGSVPRWRSSWSASAARTCRLGRVANTSLRGFVWPRATKSPAASYCRPGPGARAAELRLCCRLAATTVGRTETALGAFYRRLSARVGKAKAVTAHVHETDRHFHQS